MKQKGWLVTMAGLGLNLALGVLYAWSMFSQQLTESIENGGFGWSRTTSTLPFTIAIAFFALIMIPAGRLQDRLGPRVVATAGAVLCGTGLVVAGLGRPDLVWPMILGFGVLAGTGIGLGYAAATPAALKWFGPEKKGLITGLVVAGFGLAPVYIAPLAKHLLETRGVSGAFRIFGILFFVVAGFSAQFLVNPKPGLVRKAASQGTSLRLATHPWPETTGEYCRNSPGQARGLGRCQGTSLRGGNGPPGFAVLIRFAMRTAKPGAPAAVGKKAPKPKVSPSADRTWREMIRSLKFWILYLQFAFGATAGLMIIGHVAKIVSVQSGGAIKAGFLFVAILAVFNAGGRVLSGMVSDIIGRAGTMIIVFSLQAAIMFFFSRFTTTAGLLFGAAFAGFNYGACLSLFPATAADYWGTKNLGLNYGILFTAWGVGGVFGPNLAGMIADSTGSYAGAYRVAGGLLIFGIILGLLNRRHASFKAADEQLGHTDGRG